MRTTIVRQVSGHLAAGCILLQLLLCLPVISVPFSREFRFTQPDGTTIRLWGQGDDFSAVFETLQGYTVLCVPDARASFYARASFDGETLESTGAQVGRDDPA